MMNTLCLTGVVLCLFLGAGSSPLGESSSGQDLSRQEDSGLARHEQPYSEADVPKKRSTRQVAYLPLFALPPVYHIHHIVLVQPQEQKCQEVAPTPGPGVGPAAGPDDLLTRFGGENETTTETPEQEPSKCVWSIVACCAPGSRNVRYTCFELLGCPGAFWDVNPCEEKVVTAAANTALKYYERQAMESAKRRRK